MLQTVYAYLIGLGPYFLVAAFLGAALPAVLVAGKPEKWLVATMVLILCLIPFGGGSLASASEGSTLRQVGWSLLFTIALYLSLRGPDKRLSLDRTSLSIPYFVLLAFAVLSLIWSNELLVSAKRVLQLVGVGVVAMALVRQKADGDALLAFTWPGMVILLLGLLAGLTIDSSFDSAGGFRGITFTKNVWGQFSMLMVILVLYHALRHGGGVVIWGAWALTWASLLATGSTTSIATAAASVFMILYWMLCLKHGAPALAMGIAAAMLTLAGAFGYFVVEGTVPLHALFSAGVESVGKDATLTGRTDLWAMMFNEILRHPYLGTGYGAFWTGVDGESATIVRSFAWQPGQAHSGYIDVTNELGILGLLLLFVVLGFHVAALIRRYRSGDRVPALCHGAILLAAMLLNVSETSFVRTGHLWWIVLSVSIFEVASNERRRTLGSGVGRKSASVGVRSV